MPCWFVEGHRGAGKSLYAVKKAQEYLERGCVVASNISLNLDHLMPASSRRTYTKLPGVPKPKHLYDLGQAYDGKLDEKRNGLLILDEAGSFLNAREWNDPDRKGIYTWATQSRKYRFDLLFLIQDWEALDAQIRRAMVDIHVTAWCTDRIKIPFLPFHPPKFHLFVGHYKGPNGPPTGREWMRGTDYYSAYDTEEKVKVDETLMEDGSVVDARGSSSGLSAWHLVGRYLPPKPRPGQVLGFAVKWLVAWPALVFDRRPASDPESAMARFKLELGILLPKAMPHQARNEWQRIQGVRQPRSAEVVARQFLPSHDAYRLARYRNTLSVSNLERHK